MQAISALDKKSKSADDSDDMEFNFSMKKGASERKIQDKKMKQMGISIDFHTRIQKRTRVI